MSFSHTELSKRFALLAGSLPEFNLPLTLTAQLLRVTAERLSTHMNRCLKAEGITESLWYALLFVYVSPNRKIQPLITAKRDRIWAGFTDADHAELQHLLGRLLEKLQD